ncbi:GNAT family N-acetyltransferase [Paractinoplanes rishiriensis]|uniref:N-acetyltransferase domain-containing protein n=1 Tax=Paractinoplanes rishiriensis TaxID=1050105 RepID=A0A919N084_9ACTN|nr:GNAT family N-acetyltransferase [Actinoplanes rishiriensis]GIE94777.1 hypothetical protein Ari01nite_22420 [Actinoplanes rishiriensis]
MQIRTVTGADIADLNELFDSNSATRGCRCMWFVLSNREVQGGWGAGNRDRLTSLAAGSAEPVGVLAYDDRPVGWCAVGPRARYTRALRSPILAGHDPAEDDRVWLVPCFFVRVGHRRAGLTEELLTAAVEVARQHGATAVEGFPLAGAGPHRSDRYLGSEPLFAACGFTEVTRPSPRRVVMRHELSPDRPTAG